MKKYWIEFINGERDVFEAENDKEASWFFHTSGDHAYDWGRTRDAQVEMTSRLLKSVVWQVDRIAELESQLQECKDDCQDTIREKDEEIERLTEITDYIDVVDERASYWCDAAMRDHRALYFLRIKNEELKARNKVLEEALTWLASEVERDHELDRLSVDSEDCAYAARETLSKEQNG